ncbi:hypothetical protein GINT2_000051 [Glugoides intestinalis]
MLFKISKQIILKVKANKEKVMQILLILSLSFLFIRPTPYKLSSSESLFDILSLHTPSVSLDEPKEFEDQPAHETILITCCGTDSFKENLSDAINRIAIRSKSIKISKTDIKENFFAKICLQESNTNSFKIFPMRYYHPNSDLVFLTKSFFEASLHFELKDLFYQQFENRVDLFISNDKDSIEKLCKLLRCILNMHSYYYGCYYYIPFKNFLVKAESFNISLISFLLYSTFIFDTNFHLVIPVMIFGIYRVFPLLGMLLANRKQLSLYIIVFFSINFKFGIVFYLSRVLLEIPTIIKPKTQAIKPLKA